MLPLSRVTKKKLVTRRSPAYFSKPADHPALPPCPKSAGTCNISPEEADDMSTNEEYIMSGVFMLMGGFVFILGFVKMRKWRIIKDTPRSKIRSMAMGIVEIHGGVEADTVIKSPFSKTDCVYYKWVIKEYRKSSSSSKGGSGSYRWEEMSSGEKGIPFFAKDETGRVWVDPKGGEFHVSPKRVFYQKGKGIFGSIAALGKLIKALKNFDPHTPESFIAGDLDLIPMEERSGIQTVSVGAVT
jgi:hypothetical protein